MADAVVLELQSDAKQVAELLCEHLILHLIPAIPHDPLQSVVFLRVLGAELDIAKLAHLCLVALEVIVVLHAQVKLMDVLAYTMRLDV